MKFKIAAFIDTPKGRMASLPDGQYADGLVTFRGGMSLEEYSSDEMPLQVALMATMNRWHAEVATPTGSFEYHRIKSKDAAIIIDGLGVMLKRPHDMGAAYITPKPAEVAPTGPTAFAGSKSLPAKDAGTDPVIPVGKKKGTDPVTTQETPPVTETPTTEVPK